MSDNSSVAVEDIKKICLICGCHTKQAINIYEPRNGPNIRELIQAKFKFQPVNDDKYLCYSCNNWLINWHSLQTLNSNNSESCVGNGQSNKSSRSHINDSIPEEDYHDIDDENLKICKSNVHKDADISDVNGENFAERRHHHHHHHHSQQQQGNNELQNRKRKGFYFSKRDHLHCINKWKRIRKIRRKFKIQQQKLILLMKRMKMCSICGRKLKYLQRNHRNQYHHQQIHGFIRKSIQLKCKMCHRILEWNTTNYPKCSIDEENHKLMDEYLKSQKFNNSCDEMFDIRTNSIIESNNSNNHLVISSDNYAISKYRRCQQLNRPLVDGKVIAMLRRLGTTLTRESDCYSSDNREKNVENDTSKLLLSALQTSNTNENLIQKRHREMDENEILIDFNVTITEVLQQPHGLVKYQIIPTTETSLLSPSMLSSKTDIEEEETIKNTNKDVEIIQVESTNEMDCEEKQEENAQQQQQISLDWIYQRIPKCVTVSVIEGNNKESTNMPNPIIIN